MHAQYTEKGLGAREAAWNAAHTGYFHLVPPAKPLDQCASPVVQGGGCCREQAVEEAVMDGPPPGPAPGADTET